MSLMQFKYQQFQMAGMEAAGAPAVNVSVLNQSPGCRKVQIWKQWRSHHRSTILEMPFLSCFGLLYISIYIYTMCIYYVHIHKFIYTCLHILIHIVQIHMIYSVFFVTSYILCWIYRKIYSMTKHGTKCNNMMDPLAAVMDGIS